MNTKEIQQNILKQALADRDASIPGSPEETAAVVKIMDVVFPGYWSKRKHFRYYFDIPGFKLLLSDLELQALLVDMILRFPNKDFLGEINIDQYMDHVGFAEADFKNTLYKSEPMSEEEQAAMLAKYAAQSPSESREDKLKRLLTEFRDTKDEAEAALLKAELVDEICDTDEE